MATPNVDGARYWFDGLPVEALQQPTKNTGDTKYWYDGLPMEFLASYGPTPPVPTTTTQVFVDIRTAIHSFTQRKRMF